jgi:hypothetical protein
MMVMSCAHQICQQSLAQIYTGRDGQLHQKIPQVDTILAKSKVKSIKLLSRTEDLLLEYYIRVSLVLGSRLDINNNNKEREKATQTPSLPSSRVGSQSIRWFTEGGNEIKKGKNKRSKTK